jgi:hypothetical protein
MKKTRLFGFVVALIALLFSTSTAAETKDSSTPNVFFETKVELSSYDSLLNLDTGDTQQSAPTHVGSWRKLLPTKGEAIVVQHNVKKFFLIVKYLSNDNFPPQVVATMGAPSTASSAGSLCNTSGDIIVWANKCVVVDKFENIAKMSCIKVSITCQLVKAEAPNDKIKAPTDTTAS